MKAAGGSVPVWTAGVSRCVSQACKKNKEPVFEVKFICEEERGADSFLKHPHHPFPPTHPLGEHVNEWGRGGAGQRRRGLHQHPEQKVCLCL